MLSRRAILLMKAEYLMGRKLTDKERTHFLKTYKGDGTRVSIRDHMKDEYGSLSVKFRNVWEILEPQLFRADKMAREELLGLIKQIIVQATSVESGMKILRNALKKDRVQLMTYLFNLYLRDHGAKKGSQSQPPIALENRKDLADPWSANAVGNFGTPAAPTSDVERLYQKTEDGYLVEDEQFLDPNSPKGHPTSTKKVQKPKTKPTYLTQPRRNPLPLGRG